MPMSREEATEFARQLCTTGVTRNSELEVVVLVTDEEGAWVGAAATVRHGRVLDILRAALRGAERSELTPTIIDMETDTVRGDEDGAKALMIDVPGCTCGERTDDQMNRGDVCAACVSYFDLEPPEPDQCSECGKGYGRHRGDCDVPARERAQGSSD